MKYLIVALVLVLSGCVSSDSANNTYKKNAESLGFLSNYSLLETVKVNDDSETKRYVSPLLSEKKYTKILIEPVVFFPRPNVSETLSTNTLDAVKSYANNVIKSAIKQPLSIVNEPGPEALKLKVAITGVNTEKDSLAAYQYIPIAFLLTAASGKLNDVVVKIQIEGELSDSLTNEPLILATKSGFGETLTNNSTPLALDNVRPLLDEWGQTLQETLSRNIQ